jgi:hypothetical protein
MRVSVRGTARSLQCTPRGHGSARTVVVRGLGELKARKDIVVVVVVVIVQPQQRLPKPARHRQVQQLGRLRICAHNTNTYTYMRALAQCLREGGRARTMPHGPARTASRDSAVITSEAMVPSVLQQCPANSDVNMAAMRRAVLVVRIAGVGGVVRAGGARAPVAYLASSSSSFSKPPPAGAPAQQQQQAAAPAPVSGLSLWVENLFNRVDRSRLLHDGPDRSVRIGASTHTLSTHRHKHTDRLTLRHPPWPPRALTTKALLI